MNLQILVNENRGKILEIAARHGASNVCVFGSVARGQADEKSDLDILVTFEPSRSLLDHAALVIELETMLGCKVDVVSDKGLRPRMRDQVLRDAVAL